MIIGKSNTLAKLLQLRMASEPCDKDTRCPNATCTSKGTHTTHCTIVKWPRVLLIQLKRWDYNTRTQTRTKNNALVQFPLTHTVSPDIVFTLKSIFVHEGHAHAGHYTALVYDTKQGWLLYNDAAVPQTVTQDLVLQTRPYLFFYGRNC